MKVIQSVVLATLLLTSFLTKGQEDSSQVSLNSYFEKYRPAKQWSVGLQLSPTHAMSDADNLQPGFAYGLHVKYSVGQSFGLKLQGNIGTLRGSREGNDISGNGRRGQNNLGGADPSNRGNVDNVFNDGNQAPGDDSYFFKNEMKELALTAVFTIGNISFLRPLRDWQLFLFTGVGTVWSDVNGGFGVPQDAQSYYQSWGDDYFDLVTDANGNIEDAKTTYQGHNFTIPFGFGVKHNFGKMLDIGLEYRLNYTRTDNLDAYSFPLWRNRYSDFYGMLGVQASLKLGGTEEINEHYDWLNPVAGIYEDLDSLQDIKEKVDLLLQDTDGDGTPDYYDQEPDTEEGAWTWGNGITVDLDSDSVPDYRDDEPASEPGAIVDAKGVMVDKDKDNVPDYRDEDTNTPPSSFVRPDGTHDGGVGGACCNCDDVILPTIIFNRGSSQINPEFYGVLYTVAEKMRECPDLAIIATGYAIRSKSQANLAVKRTNAIIEHLNQTYNIPRDRFEVNTEGDAPSGVEYRDRRIDLDQKK